VALPAPNGMVALISRDGQFSACAEKATRKLARIESNGMDLRIDAPVSSAAVMA
jgi:hypothetical protein